MPNSFEFFIASSPHAKLAYSNRVYVSKSSFNALGSTARTLGVQISAADPAVNISIGPCVFLARYVALIVMTYIN